MLNFVGISQYLPSITKPIEKLSFNQKLKWTLIVLVLYFILGSITVYGVNENAVLRFEFLETVFGSKFGSLITLGIGPIVTASIILQLLVGSQIINWDMKTAEGKAKFTGAQKLLTIAFCFFESAAYVLAGAVPASDPAFVPLIMLQLALGGIIIIYLDEISTKWGIGSGVSLFIAAGVSKTLFVEILSPLDQAGKIFFLQSQLESPTGALWKFILGLMQANFVAAFFSLLPMISVIVVFAIALYAQSMKIEIPMAFAMPFGSFARRWPLKFIYTSNIPVILTAAVLANLQVAGRILSDRGLKFLGSYEQGQLVCSDPSLMCFFQAPNSTGIVITLVLIGALGLSLALVASYYLKRKPFMFLTIGSLLGFLIGLLIITFVKEVPTVRALDVFYALGYMSVMIIGSIIFSKFWVSTAGMDAASVAKQFESSNIMIPGFRRDPRIIERVLEKYIPSLAVLGGAFIGFLASFADLTRAIGTGTGILLTVMIIYQFYEQIISQHYSEVGGFAKKVVG